MERSAAPIESKDGGGDGTSAPCDEEAAEMDADERVARDDGLDATNACDDAKSAPSAVVATASVGESIDRVDDAIDSLARRQREMRSGRRRPANEAYAEIVDRKIREGAYAEKPATETPTAGDMKSNVQRENKVVEIRESVALGGAPELIVDSSLPHAAPMMHRDDGGEANGKAKCRLDTVHADDAPMPPQSIVLDDVADGGDAKKRASSKRTASQPSANMRTPATSAAAAATELIAAPPPEAREGARDEPLPPTTPKFYAVEARLVRESSSSHHADHPPPSLPIYDAVQVPEQEPEPWWKRNRILLGLGAGLVLGALVASIAIAAVVRRDGGASAGSSGTEHEISSTEPVDGTDGQTTTSSSTTATTTTSTSTTSLQGNLDPPQNPPTAPATPTAPALPAADMTQPNAPTSGCARYIGQLLEKDCDGCYPKVAIDGNTAVLGAEIESMAPPFARTILFMEFHDGSFEEMETMFVGYDIGAVAISGNTVIVGSPSDNNNTGAVYVHEKVTSGGWTSFPPLGPDTLQTSEFGSFLDIDGDLIVVGSDDICYIYRRHSDTLPWARESGWEEDGKFPPGPRTAVSIHGNTVALGSPDMESVYIHVFDPSLGEWSAGYGLESDDCDGLFGISLALTDDDGLFVGCSEEDSDTGAVYYHAVYQGLWAMQVQKIQASDGTRNDDFGHTHQIAVGSVDGKRFMAAGTYRLKSGSVYVYKLENETWREVSKLEAPANSKHFGDMLAMSGDKIVVSSGHNAYAYTLKDC